MTNSKDIATKITKIIDRVDYLWSTDHRVFNAPGKAGCMLFERMIESGGGHCWSSSRENSVYCNFVTTPETLTGDEPDLINSIRYFGDYDYLYYHDDLTHFAIFEDSANMSSYKIFPFIEHTLLTDDVLFQLSTVMTERQLEVYAAAAMLRSIGSKGFSGRLRHIDDILLELYWEPYNANQIP